MSGKFGDRLMYIDGQFVSGSDGQWIDSVNPGTEEVHGRVPVGTISDVNRAVNAAQAAQPAWAALSIWERRDVLRKLGAAMRARAAEVLPLEAADTGNTIGSLGRDVEVAANYLDFSGLGTEIKSESVPASKDGMHFSVREPYGVVARILPFNHPFLFAAAHLAAPLMAGNAVIVKTPETSPLSGTVMGEICRDVLPPGLVNIVHGPGLPTGDALVRHPKIWRIGFTGSVQTGLAIQRSAAEVAVKHVSLELGGKNAMIVCADADPANVAAEAVRGMNFAWAGQSCGSTVACCCMSRCMTRSWHASSSRFRQSGLATRWIRLRRWARLIPPGITSVCCPLLNPHARMARNSSQAVNGRRY